MEKESYRISINLSDPLVRGLSKESVEDQTWPGHEGVGRAKLNTAKAVLRGRREGDFIYFDVDTWDLADEVELLLELYGAQYVGPGIDVRRRV